MKQRALLFGGPRDGYVTTLHLASPQAVPAVIFVSRHNPGLIIASPLDLDPATTAEMFITYHRSGQCTADGAEIYLCERNKPFGRNSQER